MANFTSPAIRCAPAAISLESPWVALANALIAKGAYDNVVIALVAKGGDVNPGVAFGRRTEPATRECKRGTRTGRNTGKRLCIRPG